MSHISPEPFELTGSTLSLAEITSEHQQMNIFCLTVKRGEASDLPPVVSKRFRPSSPCVSGSPPTYQKPLPKTHKAKDLILKPDLI